MQIVLLLLYFSFMPRLFVRFNCLVGHKTLRLSKEITKRNKKIQSFYLRFYVFFLFVS